MSRRRRGRRRHDVAVAVAVAESGGGGAGGCEGRRRGRGGGSGELGPVVFAVGDDEAFVLLDGVAAVDTFEDRVSLTDTLQG